MKKSCLICGRAMTPKVLVIERYIRCCQRWFSRERERCRRSEHGVEGGGGGGGGGSEAGGSSSCSTSASSACFFVVNSIGSNSCCFGIICKCWLALFGGISVCESLFLVTLAAWAGCSFAVSISSAYFSVSNRFGSSSSSVDWCNKEGEFHDCKVKMNK